MTTDLNAGKINWLGDEFRKINGGFPTLRYIMRGINIE